MFHTASHHDIIVLMCYWNDLTNFDLKMKVKINLRKLAKEEKAGPML